MAGHFKRTLITTWPSLPLSSAEYCSAELTVDKDSVVECKVPQSMHLVTITANYVH